MRERGFIVWFVVLVVLVAVLNLPGTLSGAIKSGLREAIAPLQGAVTGGFGKVGDAWRAVRGFGDLVEKNEIMSEELVRLRNELMTTQTLQQENSELRDLLQYRERSTYDLVGSQVISRDVGGWWQTIRVGKGYMDGVDVNMAAITPDGLVGKSIDVSPRTTDLILLSDPSCKVSVKVVRTDSFGVMSGRGQTIKGQPICRMEFINKDQVIRQGDEVQTSGLGGVFPPGLLVGHVERVELDSSGLYQTAEILVNADLGRLSQVFMVVAEKDPVEDLLMRKALGAKP